MAALAAIAVCLSIYLTQYCCSFDLNSETNDIVTPVQIESQKEHVNSNSSNDYLVISSQFETGSNGSTPSEKESDSMPIEVLVTGQIITDKGVHSSNDKITLYSPSLDEKHITRSNSNGYFQLDKVTASDDYQLKITPRGLYQRYYKNISITPPYSQLHIQLETRPVSTLRGQVLNIGKLPIPNFKLKVRSQDTIKWERDIVSDSIGFFELANVPVGFLTFNSTHEGIVLTIDGYELQDDQHQYLNLVVDQGAHTISGIVFDQYGELAVGASIVLNWEYLDGNKRTSVSRRTATKQDGTFYLQGLGPGQHDLTVADLSTGATHRQALNLSYDFEELLIYLR